MSSCLQVTHNFYRLQAVVAFMYVHDADAVYQKALTAGARTAMNHIVDYLPENTINDE